MQLLGGLSHAECQQGTIPFVCVVKTQHSLYKSESYDRREFIFHAVIPLPITMYGVDAMKSGVGTTGGTKEQQES